MWSFKHLIYKFCNNNYDDSGSYLGAMCCSPESIHHLNIPGLLHGIKFGVFLLSPLLRYGTCYPVLLLLPISGISSPRHKTPPPPVDSLGGKGASLDLLWWICLWTLCTSGDWPVAPLKDQAQTRRKKVREKKRNWLLPLNLKECILHVQTT